LTHPAATHSARSILEAIRKGGGNTGVEANGMCASACVITWAAGNKKSAATTSKIGVHGAYLDKSKLANAQKDQTAKETGPLYEATWTLQIAQQLNMYGAPDHVVVKTIMTPSSDMYWLTMDDAKAWGADMHTDIAAAAPTPPQPPMVARATQADPPGLY
jgi:hypothetical protein